jgi:hypothetical protein
MNQYLITAVIEDLTPWEGVDPVKTLTFKTDLVIGRVCTMQCGTLTVYGHKKQQKNYYETHGNIIVQ